ncbi:elongator complex protein 6-like [Homarus americanus]|uniref:Elongator complex protein 6-like n=1 Tax=Homarus americanus TaxID=6706 RepID=A0A8J5TLH6_HOMAM|nr:elongator complex protein 6-like [Homarus americanus]XP_042211769.1 elongator complex protein 6-like [Homarus americanus]XP_042211770.1 elongator complex protein 6-like [Homarus americanus]KAG7174632.1 Elongator complex protein 6-like [Homarus americanus]
MFESVKSALGGSGVAVEDGGLILISETATTSASGLLTHFLASGVTNSHPVCFLTMQHTWGHYCNIGSKLGFNLKQHSDQSTIKVIEGLKLLNEVLDGGIEDIEDHPFAFILKTCEDPLRNLYKLIKQTVQPWRDDCKYFLIIIENITSLLNLGIQTKDIAIFSHYCKNLIHIGPNNASDSLIVVTRDDEKDEDASSLTKIISHSAVMHMSLRGLSSGLSREVHGDLKITVFNGLGPHQCLPVVHYFQFKLEDKNMKLFAPGTSANVL